MAREPAGVFRLTVFTEKSPVTGPQGLRPFFAAPQTQPRVVRECAATMAVLEPQGQDVLEPWLDIFLDARNTDGRIYLEQILMQGGAMVPSTFTQLLFCEPKQETTHFRGLFGETSIGCVKGGPKKLYWGVPFGFLLHLPQKGTPQKSTHAHISMYSSRNSGHKPPAAGSSASQRGRSASVLREGFHGPKTSRANPLHLIGAVPGRFQSSR